MATIAATAPLPGRRWQVGTDQLCYLIIALLAIALRWPYFGHPAPDYDEQIYQLIGERMLHGALPYVDIWDRKPIGLFLIYAFSNLVGGPGPLPYQLLACAAAAGGAILLFRLAKRFTDSRGALVAAAIYLLFLSSYEVRVGQSEIFYIPLLTGMAMLTARLFDEVDDRTMRRLSLAVMLLGGVALQIKYTAFPQCLLFGALVLARQFQLGVRPPVLGLRLLAYCALGLLPTAIAAGFYQFEGHLDAFVYANFISIFARGPLTGALKSRFVFNVVDMAVPLAVAAGAGVWSYGRQPGRQGAAYLVVAAWTGSALLGCLMMGNIYPHYFAPVLPGLITLAAPALGRTRSGPVLSCFCLVTGIIFANPVNQAEIARYDWAGYEQTVVATARFVGPNRSNCAYVFDGPTSIYRDTHSCIPTIYAYPDHLSNAMEANAIGVDAQAEVAQILASRPAVIITASVPIVPRYNIRTATLVNRAIARDYVRIGAYGYHPRTLYVNVRRDLVKPASTRS
jgi:hypothetical protein